MEQPRKCYYNCSVDGCLNSTLNAEVSFFKLPSDYERRNEWLRLINREDLIDSSYSRARVCEVHFNPNSIIINSSRKLLKKNTNPQLFLPPCNYAHKGTQAVIETADANVQFDYNFYTNAQVQTPIRLLDDALRKRKLSNEERSGKRLKTANKPQLDANTFFTLCDKFLTPNFARVVKQQTKVKTQGQGNRYNLAYKIFCLNLYYVSSQAYSLLKNTLCLPSKQTLTKMYVPVTTAISSHLMEVLKTKVKYMSDMDRNCTLVVDMMNLKSNLFYNTKEDKIYGFHEVDGVPSPEPAKYALVAMINGLYDDYTQPVGFSLLAECKNYPSVTDWIDKLILTLITIGFHVRSFVSKVGSEFLERTRAISTESPFFYVGGRKIYYIFDPPHLIKLVRDSLMTYEFHFENNLATWQYIVQFYEVDKTKRLRLAPKLTDSHIKPTDSERKKLKYAVEVFNASVAAGLSTYMDFGVIDSSAEGTIKMVEIMHDLYEFLNTSDRDESEQYQNAFRGEDYQIAYIYSLLNFFDSLNLINTTNGQNVTTEVKFVEGFQITLKSLLMLFEDLRQEGFSYLLTGRLNQTCLKQFFGQIRTNNCNALEPTSWQLVSEYRKIFFTSILKTPKKGNCTEDLTKSLLESEKLHASLSNENVPETMASNRKEIAKINLISTADYKTLNLPKKNALVYISEYLLRKCLDFHKDCKEIIAYTKGDNDQSSSQDCVKPDSKALSIIPPLAFVEFVRTMEERFCDFFRINYLNCDILKGLLNEVQPLTLSKPCQCFPLGYCKQLFVRMRIYYTVKYNNLRRNRRKIFCVKNL